MNRLGMTYKGYTGVVTDFEPETGTLSGHVVGLRGGITFESESGEGLVREFRASVDDYLAWAAEDGFEPEKPYSGKFLVRVPSELHKSAAVYARRSGTSLNSYVEAAIRTAVGRDRVSGGSTEAKHPGAAKPLPAAAQSKARTKKVTAKSRKPSA